MKKDLPKIKKLKKQIEKTKLDLMMEDGSPKMVEALKKKLRRLEEELDRLEG